MSGLQKMLVGFLLVLTGAALAVAQNQDVEGSKDHPLISRYPGSVITEYKQEEFDEFELPLGRLQEGKPEKSQHLEGKIAYIRYEYPEGRSVLEVYRNYESALRNAGFQILFSCANVEQCGSDFRGFPGQTYQPWSDRDPVRYLSAKLSRPEGDVYVSLHVQAPGQYAVHLNVIETKPMEAGLITVDAPALAGDLTRTGHVAVYGIYFDTGRAEVKAESDSALKEIAKLLTQDAKLKLYVVGHTDNVGTLASNMDLSKRRAAAVVQALTGKYGVAAARLQAEGDGPTAPVASNDTEEGRAKNRRVELVKQ